MFSGGSPPRVRGPLLATYKGLSEVQSRDVFAQ